MSVERAANGWPNRQAKPARDAPERVPRRPITGMLLLIIGSKHCWSQNGQRYDLVVIPGYAMSQIWYAQLVKEKSNADGGVWLARSGSKLRATLERVHRPRQPKLPYCRGQQSNE